MCAGIPISPYILMASFSSPAALSLAEESIRTHRQRQFRPEHLDRHGSSMASVFSQIDSGHAAGADLALDGVSLS